MTDPIYVFPSSCCQNHQRQSTATPQENASSNNPVATMENLVQEASSNDPSSSLLRTTSRPGTVGAPGTVVAGCQRRQQQICSLAATRSPIPVDRALQQLMRQLDDAMELCKACLEQYDRDTEKIAAYADATCRSVLWRQLLEDRFRASRRDQHLFRNLRTEVEYHAQRAAEAAERDTAEIITGQGNSGHADETRAQRDEVFHELAILCTRAARVGKLAEVADGDVSACKRMVKEMELMRNKCGDLDGAQNGNSDKDMEA